MCYWTMSYTFPDTLQIQTVIAYKTKKQIKATWSTWISLVHISTRNLSIKVLVTGRLQTLLIKFQLFFYHWVFLQLTTLWVKFWVIWLLIFNFVKQLGNKKLIVITLAWIKEWHNLWNLTNKKLALLHEWLFTMLFKNVLKAM